jgi:hypothetical protein
MAGHFGSGDTAADRFTALATKLSIEETTKGKGVIGGVEELQRQEAEWQASGEEGDSPLKKFLGESAELNVAFGLLVERMPDVKDRIAEIDAEMKTVAAGGRGALERKYDQSYDASTETGRLNQAMEQRRQAKVAEEIANERQFAVVGADREAASAREKARQKDAGYVGLAQYGGDVAGRMATSLGVEEDTAAVLTGAGTEAIGGQSFGGFLGRRAMSAATLGMSDVMFGGMGAYAASQEQNVQQQIQQAEARQQVAVEAKLVLQDAFRETKTNTDTKESIAGVSQSTESSRDKVSAVASSPSTRTRRARPSSPSDRRRLR